MDTLKAARTLEAKGFTREQAEGIAEVIAEAMASSGFAELRRDLDILKWMVGVMLMLAAGTLWQVIELRIEVASMAENLDQREQGLTRIESRLTNIEAGSAAIRSQPSLMQAAPGPKP